MTACHFLYRPQSVPRNSEQFWNKWSDVEHPQWLKKLTERHNNTIANCCCNCHFLQVQGVVTINSTNTINGVNVINKSERR
jgi:hypothetical protein